MCTPLLQADRSSPGLTLVCRLYEQVGALLARACARRRQVETLGLNSIVLLANDNSRMWIPVWKLAEANLTNLSRSEKHIDFVKARRPAPAPARPKPRRAGGGQGPAGVGMHEASMP